MRFLAVTTWADALAARAEHPDAVPIAGGTDVMVELNFDRRRPPALLDLSRVPELHGWAPDGGGVRFGAALPYARIMGELGHAAPGLVMASRTVGSPQIRARGSVGGNLGSASPAGDAHPVLLAVDAVVEVESAARGTRLVPIGEFFTGVQQNALQPDELIAAVRLPPLAGPQQFAKIGTRNAMVIAVTSLGLALHPGQRRVAAAFGSAAPTPRRARTAEDFVSAALPWDDRGPIEEGVLARFGELLAGDTAPIDDVRGTAAYRRHALAVLARRTLTWAWNDHRKAA